MPLYEKATVEVRDIGSRMMEKYHGGLNDANVTIDFLFAKKKPDDAGEINPESHAIKLHGYPVAAMVKVNNYKLRVCGHADAEIIIDGDRWDEWKPEEKDALIDHEIEHLELKTDKDGNVRRDDLDRPMLRVRLHDHEFGWFDSIARRHGKHSFEVQQYEKFRQAHRQTWIDFKDDESSSVSFTVTTDGKKSQTFKSAAEAAGAIVGDASKKLRKGSSRRAASKR